MVGCLATMKLPKAEPATPEEAAEMLVVQLTGDPRAPTVLALDPKALVEHFEQRMALESEAESLDAYHTEPLPPGYVVIFTIDAQRRTIYSLRPPAGADDAPRLCAVDMRVVLAEAWDRYHTRWPDGVTPEMLERLVHEPSVPGCYVRRTLWELALHHVAYTASIHAGNLIAKDPSRSAAEREAALAYAVDVQTTRRYAWAGWRTSSARGTTSTPNERASRSTRIRRRCCRGSPCSAAT